MAHVIMGLIIIAIGMSILIGSWAFKILFALLLIALGVKILTGKNYSCHHRYYCSHEKTVVITTDTLNETAVFCSLNRIIKSDRFNGGTMTIVFGGGTLDLSQVTPATSEIILDFTTVFGGIKLIVPQGWNVVCKNTSIFGGCDNHVEKSESAVTLTLKGVTVFGGIEIVH